MQTISFRKILFISILGHFTVFSLFNLSFGNRIPKAELSSIDFWGQCLRSSQLIPYTLKPQPNRIAAKPDTSVLNKKNEDSLSLPYQVKPPITLSFNTGKEAYIEKPATLVLSPRKREPTIVLHPLLPYSFPLYFKDRQVAHVELEFNIVSSEDKSSINLKRKISSGNLEVDLLALRYISHYLFVQQANFTTNKWQTVKIDLSAKND